MLDVEAEAVAERAEQIERVAGGEAASAAVPGPIGSIRNPSSPGGARQRLIGRGSVRPGGWSMKNWPGVPGIDVAALDAEQRVRPDRIDRRRP